MNRAHQHIIETGDFAGEIRPVIRPLSHSRQLFDIYRLTYACYMDQKQYFPDPTSLWIPYPHFDHIPETTILVAEFDNDMVGSISITVDGTKGLPMDSEFPRTCTLVRGQDRRIAQVWRLVVKRSCSLAESIGISLIEAAVQHLLSKTIQTSLYVVQEQEAEKCRELLNAVTLMRVPSARDLSNACSIVMRAEVEHPACMPPEKKGGSRERTPHFSRR